MSESRITSRMVGSVALLVLGAGIAGVAGVFLGPAWGWALLASLLATTVLYHLWHLYAMGRWLESSDAPSEPRVTGIWDELHAILHRSRREAGRREADLARALARWREAARALPDGVVILEDDRIEWANDTARAHLDLDPSRDAGSIVTNLVRAPEFVTYLDERDYTHPVEVRLADSRVLSIQAVAYGDAQRLVLTRDITRFDRMERMRREFVANVSHELRTPLTVIAGFVETLREGGDDPEDRVRYLELMGQQTKRMERLVADLLTLSALESAPPPPMDETVDMSALVERMGAEARALSAGKHRVEVENAAGIELVGAEREITSALGNLVSNAVRYTATGGTVRLRWIATAEGAVFEVHDTGIGIAPEHIARLTERFYRVDRGRSRETGGTGLGLAIVKHALARHGAALSIASKPGEGSVFSARFAGPRVRVAGPPR